MRLGSRGGTTRFRAALIVRPGIPLLVAIWSAASGHSARAAVFVGIACLIAIPPVADRVQQAGSRAAAPVARAVSAVLLLAVEAIVVTPAWIAGRVFRIDSMAPRLAGRNSRWEISGGRSLHPGRPFLAELIRTPKGPSTPLGKLLKVIGALTVLFVGDLTAGAIVNRLTYTRLPWSSMSNVHVLMPIEGTREAKPLTNVPDPRAHATAMAGYPWTKEYFRELGLVTFSYKPFLYGIPNDLHEKYLNIQDGARASWEPPHAGSLPTVWFFGGSTMFGEGQPDDDTIPSQFAKDAARAGHPVRVVNYGVQSYSSFQEALLLETELANHPAPNLVVLYDGANDVELQIEHPYSGPTHFPGWSGTDNRASSSPSLYTRWAEVSLIHRIWVWGKETVLGSKAAAITSDPPDPIAAAHRTIAAYTRSVNLAREISNGDHVPLRVFFQPARFFEGQRTADYVRHNLPSGVTDISDALAGPGEKTYFDDVHTNPAGATLVATRLWQQLASAVDQLPKPH